MNGIVRILKDWTLPTAIVAGGAVYATFHLVPALAPLAQWYLPYNSAVLPLCTFAVLYVTFCKIDFHRLRPAGWHLRLGLLQVALVADVMALALCLRARGQALVLVEATLVCVVSPCATAAAVVTGKLGGDLEEMTAYTMFSNFVSALLIPLCFMAMPDTGGGGGLQFAALFLAILWKVSAILLLPLLLALATKLLLPALHRGIASVGNLGYYLWAFSLVVVTATTVMNIVDAWGDTSAATLLGIALLALAACLAQFALGRILGARSGRLVEAGQGLGQKNTTFGIWAATAFLHPLSSVGPGCYILWQNIINSWEIRAHERRKTARRRTPDAYS